MKVASKKCYQNFGCKNCPSNANCSSGKVNCDLGYKLKGRQCVPNLILNQEANISVQDKMLILQENLGNLICNKTTG